MTSDLATRAAAGSTKARRVRRARPLLLGEVLIVVFLVRVYDVIKELGDRRRSVGLANAGQVVSAERTLRIDWEHAVDQWVNHRHVLALVCSYWYQFAHESVTLVVLAWLWWRRPELYRRPRNALIAINVVGLLVFVLYPVAPPRLLPGAGIVDSVAAAGFGANHGGPVPADQYAAMPSLHLAWATWVAGVLLLVSRRPMVRLLAVAYPLWMAFVVVGTGNHYVLDAVAGVATTLAAFAVTQRPALRAALRRHRGGDEPATGSAPDRTRPIGPIG